MVIVSVVTGGAVTGVFTVLVGHVVTGTVAAAPPQPGPLHEAVLVTVPVASDALAVTEYVSV